MEAKPQGLKPRQFGTLYGTAEAVPFHNPLAPAQVHLWTVAVLAIVLVNLSC